jgi:hypothetical protein
VSDGDGWLWPLPLRPDCFREPAAIVGGGGGGGRIGRRVATLCRRRLNCAESGEKFVRINFTHLFLTLRPLIVEQV